MDSQELSWARQIARGKMNWKAEMANQMENEMENHCQRELCMQSVHKKQMIKNAEMMRGSRTPSNDVARTHAPGHTANEASRATLAAQ